LQSRYSTLGSLYSWVVLPTIYSLLYFENARGIVRSLRMEPGHVRAEGKGKDWVVEAVGETQVGALDP
jgi:hypothetical protein